MTTKLVTSFLIIFSVFSTESFSQGCSDAGFCTMGAMKPDQDYSKRKNLQLRSIELTHYTGVTRFEDVIFNYVIDVGFKLGANTSIQFKVPYVRVNGVLKDTHGIGDLAIGLAKQMGKVGVFSSSLTLGAKVPLGRNDQTVAYPDTLGVISDRPLPMYYQASLGTYDFVAGYSLINSKWLLAVGIQHSLNTIDNDFVWGKWNGTDIRNQIINDYPKGRNLNRGTDLMLRIERNFRFTNFNINVGLLPIYRVNKDKVQLPNNTFEEQDGSNGLALTALLGGGYQFTTRTGIKLMNGIRIIERPINPDGLSREFVSNVSLYYKF